MAASMALAIVLNLPALRLKPLCQTTLIPRCKCRNLVLWRCFRWACLACYTDGEFNLHNKGHQAPFFYLLITAIVHLLYRDSCRLRQKTIRGFNVCSLYSGTAAG